MSHTDAPCLLAEDVGLVLPTGRDLLKHISLSVGRERTALVGANGVGKSILLDILAGVRTPTTGRVVRQGTVAYVPQGRALAAEPGETVRRRLGVDERLSALARVLDGGSDPADLDIVGDDGWGLPERVDADLHRFGLGHLSLDRPVAGLSGGEATRVTLLGAFLSRPDLLVLDEPTNDLDQASRDSLVDMVRTWSGALLLVSHDRSLLREVDRILELTPAGIRAYGGNYDHYREQRDQEAAAAEEAFAQARAARKRLAAEARRTQERDTRRAARGARSRAEGSQPKLVLNAKREQSQKSAGRRAQTLADQDERARSRVVSAQARVEETARPRMEVGPSDLPASKQVLVVDDVTYTHPGAAEPTLSGFGLEMYGPERVAVTGPNGSGKTTLLRLLAGDLTPDTGRVHLGVPPERIAYLDQTAAVLDPEATVLACFRDANPEMDEGHARHTLARFLFPGDGALAPVAQLSGGERVRAALACLLGGARSPGLLILDEPTNHLDLPSLETVEEALGAYDGALLVVSHDPDFLEGVGVDRTVSLHRPTPPTGSGRHPAASP